MWVLVQNNEVVRVFSIPASFRDKQGILHPKEAFEAWTPEELRAKGIYPLVTDDSGAPSPFHRPSGVTYDIAQEFVTEIRQWSPIPLEAAKLQARQIINSWKVQHQDSTFEYDGKTFQCDPRSRQFISGASLDAFISKDDPEFVQYFTDADNETHAFTADEMIELGKAAKAHVEYWHLQAVTKKALIDAAETIEDLITALSDVDVESEL